MTNFQLITASLTSAQSLACGVVALDVLNAVQKARLAVEHVRIDNKAQLIKTATLMLERQTGVKTADPKALIAKGFLKPKIIEDDTLTEPASVVLDENQGKG